MEKLTIRQLAEDDRPREKMMQKGAEALSDAELIAILIGSGNKEESAVTLSQRMLSTCGGDLNQLSKWQLEEYACFKGMGPAKSLTVMAALELGRRRKLQERMERPIITSSVDTYESFHPLMADLPTEEFWVLLLNRSNRVIGKERISSGGIDQTTADVRTILREALLARATQIVVVHNHPSGNTRPSQEDRRITERIKEAGRVMSIHLTDHVIVCDGAYFSFNDQGLL